MNTLLTVWIAVFLATQVYGTKISKYQVPFQPLDCYTANTRCYSDAGCKIQLDAIVNVCDKQVDMCNDPGRPTLIICDEVLRGLQNNMYFYKCTCGTNKEQLSNCLYVQRTIHEHPCSSSQGSSSGHIVRARDYPVNMAPVIDETEYIEEDYDEEMDEDDQDDAEGGCIRARKNCLGQHTCSTALTNYRIKCKESKKQNRCMVIDREGCFSAINIIRSLSPEIFTCQCNQKRNISFIRCQNIRYRLSNNTCLVDVPYFIHSRQPQETTYDILVSIINEPNKIEDKQQQPDVTDMDVLDRSTCQRAFVDCDKDPGCKKYMKAFITACTWSKSQNNCNRSSCLQSIKDFYTLIPQRKARALLFCQCKKDDGNCDAVKRAMYPTCSLVEAPAPSCVNIMDRCRSDPDCSQRYDNYVKLCGYERGETLCPEGPGMCRDAMIDVMGTILTTNCTCVLSDHGENKNCMEIRWKLQGTSSCRRDAIEHFHMGNDGSVTEFIIMDGTHHPPSNRKGDCIRVISAKFPIYYETPDTIRKFSNNSECSELCMCFDNGKLKCTKLPCRKDLSCRQNDVVYVHGSSFKHNSRGKCRCIKSEMVCARPWPSGSLKPPGLFLHIGYSISDKNLIEEHSKVRFSNHSITTKLATLMNGDSAKQFCTLKLYHQDSSNFILMVNVSQFNTKEDGMAGCVSAAKQLCYMVDSRHPVIVTDAELSIIKVAQLENISIYTHTRQKGPMEGDQQLNEDPVNNNARVSSHNMNNNSNQPTVASYRTNSKCSIHIPNTLLLYILSFTLLLYFNNKINGNNNIINWIPYKDGELTLL